MSLAIRLRTVLAIALLTLLFSTALRAVNRTAGHHVLRTDDDIVVRFGPFDPAGFVSSINVDVDESGELVLDHDPLGYAESGWATLARVDVPEPFDTVHVGVNSQVPQGSSVQVQVRVTDRATDRQSRWYAVEREAELQLPAQAKDVQVRIVMRSSDGQSTPRVGRVSVETLRRIAFTPPSGTADPAAVPMPALTTREMWGAHPPKDPYNPQEPAILTVHHTFQPDHASYTGEQSVRGIQKFHMDERAWSDIGYHFLIGPDGTLFEGRPPTAVGAHAPPNTSKVGICVIGNFNPDKDTVTPKQREVLVNLLAHLAGKYRITTKRIFGHRDTQQTDCPGETLYAQLPSIRAEVDVLITAARRTR